MAWVAHLEERIALPHELGARAIYDGATRPPHAVRLRIGVEIEEAIARVRGRRDHERDEERLAIDATSALPAPAASAL